MKATQRQGISLREFLLQHPNKHKTLTAAGVAGRVAASSLLPASMVAAQDPTVA